MAAVLFGVRSVLSCRPIPGALPLLWLAICAGAGSISAHADSARADRCTTRVIVAFAKDQGNRPSDRFVRELAHSDGIQLTFLRTIGPGLYLFSLTAPGTDCRDALERLRHDAQVRSVDVDERREVA